VKRSYFVTIILFFSIHLSVGQILDNSNVELFGSEPFFNVEFIKQNQIKTIHGNFSIKRDRQPIRQLNLFQHFEFNNQGQLIMQMESYYKRGGWLDTAVVLYHYHESGKLLTKRTNDAYGFYSYHYEYDEDDNIIKETYCRDENIGSSKSNFVPGKEFTIKSETFEHLVPGEYQYKKLFYNNQGKLYKEKMIYYNKIGNKTEETEKYIVTNKRSNILYEYDDYNHVQKISEVPDLRFESKNINTFSYDEVGNIISEEINKDSKPSIFREYLYDPSTMLLKDRLVKDEATKAINIIRYSYEFF